MPVTQHSGQLRGKAQVPGQSGLLKEPVYAVTTIVQKDKYTNSTPNQMTAKQTQSQRPTCNPNTSVVYWPSRVPMGVQSQSRQSSLPLAPFRLYFHGAHHQLHPETGISLSHWNLLVPFWGPGVCLAFLILSSPLCLRSTNSRGQSSSSPSCTMFSKGKHSDDPNNVIRDPDTSSEKLLTKAYSLGYIYFMVHFSCKSIIFKFLK